MCTKMNDVKINCNCQCTCTCKCGCCCNGRGLSSGSQVTFPEVGKPAPDFKCDAVMANNEVKKISLSEMRGQYVLLFFYPFDFTFVCPSEIVAFDKAMPEFKKRNVEVLGCSIDSAFVHTAWKKTDLKNGGIGPISYPLIADVTHEVAKTFGVLMDGGMALRGLFLIDKQGVLQHALVNNLPIGRSVDEALRTVDALQFHEQNGEVCPANWKKGAKAMKPTPAGVAEYMANNV
eukprot:GHVQ01033133.1.p1 GENE.GHVQ01033133.1~~GHVQ01033133.1.p1  ORF type:complete len:233 (+),score=27.87 GHVQ01033133.1:211-909(+)